MSAILDDGRGARGTSSRRGRLTWLLMGLFALLVFDLTANPVLAVAVGCIKFGWDELATARWLWLRDPIRVRGRVSSFYYAAWALWRVAGVALALMLLVGWASEPILALLRAQGRKVPGVATEIVAAGLVTLAGLRWLTIRPRRSSAVSTAWRSRRQGLGSARARWARHVGASWPPSLFDSRAGTDSMPLGLPDGRPDDRRPRPHRRHPGRARDDARGGWSPFGKCWRPEAPGISCHVGVGVPSSSCTSVAAALILALGRPCSGESGPSRPENAGPSTGSPMGRPRRPPTLNLVCGAQPAMDKGRPGWTSTTPTSSAPTARSAGGSRPTSRAPEQLEMARRVASGDRGEAPPCSSRPARASGRASRISYQKKHDRGGGRVGKKDVDSTHTIILQECPPEGTCRSSAPSCRRSSPRRW